MVKAALAVTDEGDEGGVPLIDMTKVTRSTLADKLLPNRATEQFKGDWLKDGARKQRDEIRGEKPYQEPKMGCAACKSRLLWWPGCLVLLSIWQAVTK
ncbi:hypothetical protein [Aeromonas enteropelogenes]|uniref:hypothetical protein n=1 Tax=Aeromonas enteropelogenes TaxID=29489 RepID=UPI003BA0FD9E